MKIKVEFAAFRESIIAPGTIGSEVTLTKSTKYQDIEMEYDTEGYLVIRVKKDTSPVLIPSANIKSMVVSELPVAKK